MEQQNHTPIAADAVNLGTAARMRMEGASATSQKRTQVHLPEMIATTARLVQILAEEVDCLDEMRIADIEALQEEKRRLGRTLEAMKREVERRPEIREGFAGEDIATFTELSEIFNEVLEENHRKLLVAKEINFRVVQAISDVVREETLRNGYDRRGTKGVGKNLPPHISLNKQI